MPFRVSVASNGAELSSREAATLPEAQMTAAFYMYGSELPGMYVIEIINAAGIAVETIQCITLYPDEENHNVIEQTFRRSGRPD